MINDQWIRKIGLFLYNGDKALDLSEFHIKFSTQNADVETPNNASIRVYNLSAATVKRITATGEFTGLSLNAGYVGGNYGVIFQGTIKQYRIGRENATDTYLDIFASDGDLIYINGVVNTNLAKGQTLNDTVNAINSAMTNQIDPTLQNTPKQADTSTIAYDKQHVPNIRGQVLFGMGKTLMRHVASTLDASWSIQNGQLLVLNRSGYTDDEEIAINVGTGLIGLPEQTDGGIRISCLLNSKLRIGGRVKLNNDEIIQLMMSNPNAAPIAYNQWSGFQYNAPISNDGTYRAYVVEHEGDTRGGPWYSHITCLAVNPSAPQSSAISPGI